MKIVRKRTRPGIPTGICLKAQGCEERATLGELGEKRPQPQRGCDPFEAPSRVGRTAPAGSRTQPRWPLGLCSPARAFTQGSSFLPTLAVGPESLWDSANVHPKMSNLQS